MMEGIKMGVAKGTVTEKKELEEAVNEGAEMAETKRIMGTVPLIALPFYDAKPSLHAWT